MVIKNPLVIVKSSGGGGKTPTDWGRLYVYNWKEGFLPQYPDNCDVTAVDLDVLKAAIEADPGYSLSSPLPSGWEHYAQIQAYFDTSSWSLTIAYDDYNTGDNFWIQAYNVSTSDLESVWGIQVQITDDSQSASFSLQYATNVDTSGDVYPIVVPSQETYEQLIPDSNQRINIPLFGGLSIPPDAIKEFDFGSQPTTTPQFFLSGCTNLTSVDMTEATGITTVTKGFLTSCSALTTITAFPSGVTSIGDNFMENCPSFNSPLDFSHVTTFGMYFMSRCYAFNQYVDLSSAVTIGGSFLYACVAFSQSLTIPSTVTSVGLAFMYSTRGVTELTINSNITPDANTNTLSADLNTAPMYTTGITLKGTGRSNWLTALPNRDTRPYRKLIDGEA